MDETLFFILLFGRFYPSSLFSYTLSFVSTTHTLVNTKNKAILFVKRPEYHHITGEYFVLQHTELASNLEDGDIITRNYYLSLDLCNLFFVSHVSLQSCCPN
ncbi:hypothetical protein F5H01DRAFT_159891 [Linnemannia elongata]|nr:hypothetical protein F5H01DRAFT_159891 [Linnemannia elongata]